MRDGCAVLADMAQAARVPTVATGDVLYHVPARRILQDVVTCIREGCTIDQAGFRRERTVDRCLKSPNEMARLFARHPEAVARTLEIVERCRFSLARSSLPVSRGGRGPGADAAADVGEAGLGERAATLSGGRCRRMSNGSCGTSCD